MQNYARPRNRNFVNGSLPFRTSFLSLRSGMGQTFTFRKPDKCRLMSVEADQAAKCQEGGCLRLHTLVTISPGLQGRARLDEMFSSHRDPCCKNFPMMEGK